MSVTCRSVYIVHGRLSYTLSGDLHVAPEGLIQFDDNRVVIHIYVYVSMYIYINVYIQVCRSFDHVHLPSWQALVHAEW